MSRPREEGLGAQWHVGALSDDGTYVRSGNRCIGAFPADYCAYVTDSYQPTWPPRARPVASVPLRVSRELLNPARPKALQGLALALMVLYAIDAVLCLVLAYAYLQRAGIVEDMAAGAIPRDPTLILSEPGTRGVWALAVLAFLTTAAVMIPWLWRFVNNAGLLASGVGPSAGWAVAGLFIPAVGTFIVGTVLSRADRLSDAPTRRRPWLIWSWVAALATALVLERYAGSVTSRVLTLDTMQQSASLSGVSQLLLTVAAVLALLMVRAVTRRQGEGFTRRAEVAQEYARSHELPDAYVR